MRIILVSLISVFMTGQLYAVDKPLSEDLEKEKQTIEETRTTSKKEREQAAKVTDRETLLVWDEIDPFFEAKAKCFNESEEIDIRVCILKVHEKLAAEGNFIAQDFLGKLYQNYYNNPAMALKWYQEAFKNPRTPAKYRYVILSDLESLEKTAANNKAKPEDKPFSDELKKYMTELKAQQKIIEVERRKAEILEDELNLALFQAAEETINSRAKCADKPNEHAVMICVDEEISRLANQGNFYAQHQLGNMYETGFKNKAQAIKWYQAALDNPKTPAEYKPQIEADLKRAKES